MSLFPHSFGYFWTFYTLEEILVWFMGCYVGTFKSFQQKRFSVLTSMLYGHYLVRGLESLLLLQ